MRKANVLFANKRSVLPENMINLPEHPNCMQICDYILEISQLCLVLTADLCFAHNNSPNVFYFVFLFRLCSGVGALS